ncbi:dephospho-CoA kinase [Humitalea sp. 24SJ18S-53]|uniref:dephospho-CoA kinase n=1 Tax=Humitalea sp. 24SJ18S-53 TaxID=3422307 RepID=UPI003D676B63
MKILGLTGSIGMGKTTAARAFRRLKVPVFDADAAVHVLQAPGGAAVRPIGAAFPGTVVKGVLAREALRSAVLGNPAALRRLEAIVHPLVRRMERRFLSACRRRAEPLVVLDVPLLFETRPDPHAGLDAILVVSAPAAVQRARVLRRPGMTPARLDAILARQMPDSEKRARADHVLHNGLSKHHAQAQVRRLVRRYRPNA